jgi:hypothetical protein
MTKEQTMSALRTRMIEDMQLAGLSATTQKVYLQAVTALVKHYRNRSPDQLTEEEVRCYLLAVRQRNARETFKTCHYGTLHLIRPPVNQTIDYSTTPAARSFAPSGRLPNGVSPTLKPP